MKLKLSAILSVPVVMILSASANAVGEYFPDGFTSVAPINWVQDPSISSSYNVSYVSPGINDWNTISTKVRVNKVNSGAYQVRVAVEYNSGDPNVTGRMFPYCAAGNSAPCISPPYGTASRVTTWMSAKVVGNEDSMAAAGWTSTNRTQTFAHEMGHALSMAHTGVYTSTMYEYGPSNYGVQSYDKDNLKAKWGN